MIDPIGLLRGALIGVTLFVAFTVGWWMGRGSR